MCPPTSRNRRGSSGHPGNRHVGSSLDAFLKEEGILEALQAQATEEVDTWQLKQATKKKGVSIVATIELVTLRPGAGTKKDPLQRDYYARWPAPNAVPEDGGDEKPRVGDEGADK